MDGSSAEISKCHMRQCKDLLSNELVLPGPVGVPGWLITKSGSRYYRSCSSDVN